MALAAVLSAMKEIILDAPSLPLEEDKRRAFLVKTFPRLSDSEAEDLAKIEPSKFGIYTNSIFSGERDLIQRNFGMTIEYLKLNWQEVAEGDFNLKQLIKDLHKFKAWKSSHTVDLGRNFVEFIKARLSPIQKKVPFLYELAEMELLLRIVRRSPDDKIMAKHSITMKEMSELTVEKILALNFLIPSCVEFTQFNWDLISARSAYLDDEKKIPPVDEVKEKHVFCSLSRNREALQRWTEYDENFHGFLKKLERENTYSLAYMAERFLESSDQTKSEEELFKEYISLVSRCAETGAIVVRA